MPQFVTKTATQPVRSDGTLRLAVVADSHSALHKASPKLLEGLQPDAILHAGDIGDLAVLDELAKVAPVHAIRGNIDVRAHDLPDALVLDLAIGSERVLRILLVHIGVNGPRLRADVARMARAAEATLVICGHSHVPFIGRDKGISVFNPGSLGPRRFGLPIVFGTLDLSPTAVRLAHIDCETGATWSPP